MGGHLKTKAQIKLNVLIDEMNQLNSNGVLFMFNVCCDKVACCSKWGPVLRFHKRARFNIARVTFMIVPYESSTVHDAPQDFILSAIPLETQSRLCNPKGRNIGVRSLANWVARHLTSTTNPMVSTTPGKVMCEL
jgi:hypothetical protein